MKLWCTTKGCI